MVPNDSGKLTKLTIESAKGGKSFEVMFNPESYSETFSTEFKKNNTTNSGIEEYTYIKSLPPDFKLKFILDGTGVTDYHDPNLPVFKKLDESVYDQVNVFLGMAWYPDNGKPTPLIIKWNKFIYHCLLKDVTINYTLFSREGLPLRAELDASFIGNTEENTKYYKSRFSATGSLNSSGSGSSSNTTGSSGGSSGGASSGSAASPNTQNGIVISVS